MSKTSDKKNLSTHFLAGGGAGLCEALCCHPLDTVKVRMQLSKKVSYKNIKIFNAIYKNSN
jgi:solute carrier family 25 (mitochondrial citrate transporter), member 1